MLSSKLFTNWPIAAIAGALLLLPAGDAAAEDVKTILTKADQAGHLESAKLTLVQTVINPSGDKRSFKMLSYSKGGNEQGLTEYTAPNQVRGMKILTLNDGDDIWVYFPRTNRTRKIASSARNRRVQGSDFTYDDMATGKLAKHWKGKLLGTAEADGVTCFKLELVPTKHGPRSYSKAVAWIAKADYTPRRIVYFDQDGDKIKRLDLTDYHKIAGVMMPFEYTMTNLTDGGRTVMKVQEAKVNVRLPGGLFAESSLGK